jgi:hypothetical protein
VKQPRNPVRTVKSFENPTGKITVKVRSESFLPRKARIPSPRDVGLACFSASVEKIVGPRQPEQLAGLGFVLEKLGNFCIRQFSHFDLQIGWLG